MTVEICIADNNDSEEWNTIVSESSQGTIFHQWDWLKIANKYTQSTLYPLIGLKGTTPVGIFPLFFQRKGPVRLVFSPPPCTALFYLGPVLINYETLKQERRENTYIEFLEAVEKFIKNECNPNYISIGLSPALQDSRPFAWSGYTIVPNYDYVTDLSIGPDKLLLSLDKKGRQNLTRARKRGVTVEIGAKKEYEAILDLLDTRYEQQGLNILTTRKYFLDVYDAFKENLKIFVAKVNGEIVTGNIDFQYKNIHYSWIGNPKPKVQLSPSPNDLLIWESIRYACEQGCSHYVTMSAAGNKRLYSYYSAKFNPDLKIRYLAKKTTYVAGLLESGYLNVFRPIKQKSLNIFKTDVEL